MDVGPSEAEPFWTDASADPKAPQGAACTARYRHPECTTSAWHRVVVTRRVRIVECGHFPPSRGRSTLRAQPRWRRSCPSCQVSGNVAVLWRSDDLLSNTMMPMRCRSSARRRSQEECPQTNTFPVKGGDPVTGARIPPGRFSAQAVTIHGASQCYIGFVSFKRTICSRMGSGGFSVDRCIKNPRLRLDP
jgi:hypothetical protein